jgi:chromosome segregation ATPase
MGLLRPFQETVQAMKSTFGPLPRDLARRVEAILERLDGFHRRARELLRQSVETKEPEGERERRLEEIESHLAELEERLKKSEEELREKESPPETFGSASQFSTGPHFPGLG